MNWKPFDMFFVNVASMASYTPVNVMNAYCTSKAAVFMFSDCLRAELDSFGIGLTTICPGFISTNIVDTTRISLAQGRDDDVEVLRGRAQKGFSVRKYGPEKVADAIVDAVRTNRAIRPVAPEARFVYGVAHALPQVLRSTARGERNSAHSRIATTGAPIPTTKFHGSGHARKPQMPSDTIANSSSTKRSTSLTPTLTGVCCSGAEVTSSV